MICLNVGDVGFVFVGDSRKGALTRQTSEEIDTRCPQL
jgi:hypothetical protein